LGQSRVVAVSVADGERGSVLYNRTAVVREGDSLDAQLDGIAREIAAQGGYGSRE
jgi:hypothetical protein